MSDLVGKPEDRFSHNEAHLFPVPDVDVFRQNISSSLRAVTGASTVSSSVEQSPKKCLNDPQQLSDGFGKGKCISIKTLF